MEIQYNRGEEQLGPALRRAHLLLGSLLMLCGTSLYLHLPTLLGSGQSWDFLPSFSRKEEVQIIDRREGRTDS